ncbi:hypothetical protein V7152_24595 [Neobacillus drentensis]
MELYELITLREYWGNHLESTRTAKLFSDGRLEFEPEPDYPDEDYEDEDDPNDYE